MTAVKIPFGTSQQIIDIPDENLLALVNPKLPAPLEDPGKSTIEALEKPIKAKPLSDLLDGAKRVALIIDNFARPTRYQLILPRLIKAVEKAGAEPLIIVGNGGLRKTTEEELMWKLGRDILDSGISVVQSVAKRKEDYEFIGMTSYGTPVCVNKHYNACDVKIGIHTCQMTLWGYGGGGSIVLPGVCMFETIEWNHRLGICEGSITPGYIGEKNFLRNDIEEAARLSGLSAVVNFVLNPDGEILHVSAGDASASHKDAIKRFDEIYSYGIKDGQRADIAIGGAFKWDKYFAHACWGVPTLIPVTKDEGTIIIVAPCSGGLAHFAYIKDYMPPNSKNLKRLLMDIYHLKQELWHAILWYPIYLAMMKKNIIAVTEKQNIDAFKEVGVEATTSLDEAYKMALKKHSPNEKVLVAPYAKWAKPIAI